jgi:hypothetical protein
MVNGKVGMGACTLETMEVLGLKLLIYEGAIGVGRGASANESEPALAEWGMRAIDGQG